MRIENVELSKDTEEDLKVEAKVAKCPECGGKYIVQTGYCPSCKKKVGGKKEEVETEEETPIEEEAEIIEIPEEVKLAQEDGSTIVLEVGDRIQVVNKNALLTRARFRKMKEQTKSYFDDPYDAEWIDSELENFEDSKSKSEIEKLLRTASSGGRLILAYDEESGDGKYSEEEVEDLFYSAKEYEIKDSSGNYLIGKVAKGKISISVGSGSGSSPTVYFVSK